MKSPPLVGARLAKNELSAWLVGSIVFCIPIGGVSLHLWMPGNVALTPPYFHDGSAATLADEVRIMAKYQLGRRLTDQEIELIVKFPKTLTGELNGRQL
jgi:hypothetical protein